MHNSNQDHVDHVANERKREMPKGKRRSTVDIDVTALEFEEDPDFTPIRKHHEKTNALIAVVENAEPGVWYKVPADLSVEERDAVISRLRSAGNALDLSIKVRFAENDEFDAPAAPEKAGWQVAGPINRRGPRKPKEQTAA
jgi:hypothetical protein